MAYVSQELKKELAPNVKVILKKYGLQGSFSVQHHSALVLTIRKGHLDFIKSYNENVKSDEYKLTDDRGHIQVNEYHLDSSYSGKVLKCLEELHEAINKGNFDKSDLMADYHHVGWYTYINVGRWNKPYVLI